MDNFWKEANEAADFEPESEEFDGKAYEKYCIELSQTKAIDAVANDFVKTKGGSVQLALQTLVVAGHNTYDAAFYSAVLTQMYLDKGEVVEKYIHGVLTAVSLNLKNRLQHDSENWKMGLDNGE